MTTAHKIAVAVALLLAVSLAFAGYEWLQEHDAHLKAESVQSQAQKVIDANQKAALAAQADRAQTDKTLAAAIAALEAERRKPVNAEQVITDAKAAIPALPEPLRVVQGQLPNAPDVVIPQADFQALRNYKISCDETSAKFTACTKDSVDLQAELSAGKGELTATQQQRDAWKVAANGGTFWRRTVTAAKWIGVGALAGGAAVYAVHK